MRALIIEDDSTTGWSLMNGLQGEDYAVDWVRDGIEGEHALTGKDYDVVFLDLGLPRRNGFAILRSLRSSQNDTPILVITGRGSVGERIAGLDSGADDYIVKPFELEELLARARMVIRRRAGRADSRISYGALTLDPVAHSVSFRGSAIELSAREFSILETLLQEPGAVVSRERLEAAVYGWGREIESNCVEVYLHKLRRKLDHGLICNVRSVGYLIALL